MRKPLHVLIIPSWYPEYTGHYAGSFFREQAIGVSNCGCKVGLIYPELRSLRGLRKVRIFPKIDIYNDNGIITHKILWSNWFIKMKSMQIYFFKFLGLYLFKHYVKINGKPDLIHCQSIFNAGFLAQEIKIRYKIPYLVTEHNSGFYYNNQGFDKYKRRTLEVIKNSERCFAVSESYASYLSNKFKSEKKWLTHYNIVSNLFLKTELKPPPSKENFTYICVSRLDKIKNIQLLIYAFKKFIDKVPNVKLKIIGVGSEYTRLKKLTTNLNLDPNIKFLGKIDRSEIVDEFKNSNALLYSSSFETFGVIFIESMAVGRPVVTTYCRSSDEIINKDVGIVTKNSSEDLFKGILYTYSNYEKFNSKKIREYCEKKFSEKKLSNKLIKVYKEVINES